MLTIETSASFWTDSPRSASRPLFKRPVRRCLTGWTSGAGRTPSTGLRASRAASSRIISASLVGPEERALDQFVQEAPKAAALDPDAVHDAGDVVAVAEGHVAAGGISGQLLRQILEQAEGVRGEQRLELADAGAGPAAAPRPPTAAPP